MRKNKEAVFRDDGMQLKNIIRDMEEAISR